MNASQPSPRVLWMRVTVLAAAAHGLYGAAFLSNSAECASLWVAVSAGLAISALDPLRYWPAILAGLTARVLPPLAYALTGQSRAISLTLADAIWWAPLSFLLACAYFSRLEKLRLCPPSVLHMGLRARTDRGATLEQLSRNTPVLLVFLRHGGCTFCREALADIAAQRGEIEASGTTIVLVHMDQPGAGRDFFGKYGLGDLHQISDPCRGLYRAFGLRRGDLRMLFGPKVWVRGLDAGVLKGHGAGPLAGDGLQMPGIFMIFHGQVIRSYRHQSAADRPNYVRFLNEDSFPRMVS